MLQDQQPKMTLEDMLRRVHQEYTKAKYCLHFDAPQGCSKPIINAHTIQQSRGLIRIAENSKVMDFNGSGADIIKQGKIVPKLIGINEASVFTGFCGLHDNQTFRPIETQPFYGHEQQCFLLAYRAICHELYERQITVNLSLFMQEKGKKVPLAERRADQQLTDRFVSWQVYRRDCTLFHKRLYDGFLKAEDYSLLKYYVVYLDDCPDLLCSTAFCPRFDFAGNILQTADRENIFDIITCSIIPTDKGGAIIFSWVGESRACQRFVQSLHAYEDEALVQAVVRLLFYSVKIMYGHPAWWNGLDKTTQRALINKRQTGMSPEHSLRPTAYQNDGLKSARWKVATRESNINSLLATRIMP